MLIIIYTMFNDTIMIVNIYFTNEFVIINILKMIIIMYLNYVILYNIMIVNLYFTHEFCRLINYF